MINGKTYCINATIPLDQYGMLVAQLFNLGMLRCEEQMTSDGIRAKIYFQSEQSVGEALDRLIETDWVKNVSVSCKHN